MGSPIFLRFIFFYIALVYAFMESCVWLQIMYVSSQIRNAMPDGLHVGYFGLICGYSEQTKCSETRVRLVLKYDFGYLSSGQCAWQTERLRVDANHFRAIFLVFLGDYFRFVSLFTTQINSVRIAFGEREQCFLSIFVDCRSYWRRIGWINGRRRERERRGKTWNVCRQSAIELKCIFLLFVYGSTLLVYLYDNDSVGGPKTVEFERSKLVCSVLVPKRADDLILSTVRLSAKA